MTNTTDTETETDAPGTRTMEFDAARLPACREALAKAWARVARAAAKAGENPGTAPELVVVSESSTLKCTGCKRTGHGGALPGDDCEECDGVYVGRRRVKVEISTSRPALAGWELLAVVEPLNGEALIRQVPGAVLPEGFTFEAWRAGAPVCDHCGTTRKRTETFIVRADESGTAVAPVGTVRQVGRNCLAAFLGGTSYASIVARLAWDAVIAAAAGDDEGGFGGGWRDASESTASVLALTVARVRLHGWVSKGNASQYAGTSREQVSTAVMVAQLMAPPPVDAGSRARWQALRVEHAPTAADLERAASVLAWARELPGASEYERNLQLVARGERTDSKHFGVLCSAVAGYERAHPVARPAAAQGATSAHVGTVGARLDLELTVERVTTVATDYGNKHIHTMVDAAGNALVWMTTSQRLEQGRTIACKATIKAHGEYRGRLQTELARVKVAEPAKIAA